MEYLDTPDDRFENLKDYPFELHFVGPAVSQLLLS